MKLKHQTKPMEIETHKTRFKGIKKIAVATAGIFKSMGRKATGIGLGIGVGTGLGILVAIR